MQSFGEMRGCQQRAAIARALIGNPENLPADEPTGNLGSATGAEIMDLLRVINRDSGQTFYKWGIDRTVTVVDEGLMWGQILEILAKKAAEGVDVRVMYDGACEFALLPHDYPKRLKALGIKCKAFAPVTPFVSTHYNYRDHRKILVIDGHTAFTGGVNLADEYINHKKKFRHWKDTDVMMKGEAVRRFTQVFLQMWGIDEQESDYGK